jgi:hypothetical protein
MTEKGITAFHPLNVRPTDELVSSVDSEPYWIFRRSGKNRLSIAALAPDDLDRSETIYDRFNRLRWLQLLPLLHFLKRIRRRDEWQPPPMRACLMFDDPNLHWNTYGYVDLPLLARHARRFGYHVSLAMVPLDTCTRIGA